MNAPPPDLYRRKIASSAVLLLAGCSAAPRPSVPLTLTIDFAASPKINPDNRGRPSPIVLRLYELRSAAAFDSADFFSLNDKDISTLGGDLIRREELVVQPGQTRSIELKVSNEGKLIAVVAAFRDLEKAVWRSKSSLPEPVESGRFFGARSISRRLTVVVDERTISFQQSPSSQ
jgi:type VI secretion system protein VasD